MGNNLCDRKDVRFFLYDVLRVQELCRPERHRDHSPETFTVTIDTAEKPVENNPTPAREAEDQAGCITENGKVRVPPVYYEPYRKIAQGSTAYLHALNSARDSIMVNAEVRRNLLWMKCYTEGVRALILYAIACMERIHAADDEHEKGQWNDILEFLTPICKAYGSEKGFEVCVKAIQVFGGYGDCSDCHMEQIARDCKVTSYKDTNGIQSLELINHKISMKCGRAYREVLSRVKETIGEALVWNELIPYASDLRSYVGMLEEITDRIQIMKTNGEDLLVESWALSYLEIWGDILLGWLFLWQAFVARERLAETQGSSAGANEFSSAFYRNKIATAKYYLGTLLPLAAGKFEAINKNDRVFLEMDDSYFFD
ncbi:MAG: hypothetical protein GXY92_00105 [Syntrophomonadaceae bacterium]|nr:hypothetical protein [Syntrophomonadaceae bacterium]